MTSRTSSAQALCWSPSGELSQVYDLVVLDSAPIFAVADPASRSSPLADTTIVTARSWRTPARALAAPIAQPEIARHGRMPGVALNRVDARGGRRSFYDRLRLLEGVLRVHYPNGGVSRHSAQMNEGRPGDEPGLFKPTGYEKAGTLKTLRSADRRPDGLRHDLPSRRGRTIWRRSRDRSRCRSRILSSVSVADPRRPE